MASAAAATTTAAGHLAYPAASCGGRTDLSTAGNLAHTTGTELRVIDVGTLGPDLGAVRGYGCRKVRAGSRNLATGPALTGEEFERALAVGREEALAAAEDGMRVLAAGEMGIGNSTPASCLTALLAGVPVETVVGRGAGADDDTLARKRAVVSASR